MSSDSWSKEMQVTKRNGSKVVISFDKIIQRLKKLQKEITVGESIINYTTLTMKVIDQLFDGIPTTQIDELSAEQCATMSSIHPDYGTLASRIIISNHHKSTPISFTKAMKRLYHNVDKHGRPNPLIAEDVYATITANGKMLDALCDYSRDYDLDYFGFKTLLRAYLMRVKKEVVERPQHMWLRVALGMHGSNLERVKETYLYMSSKCMTHATPTLFNCGRPRSQNSSCFLLAMEDDSIEGIYDTLKDCALISKWSGGIGLHLHNIRATGSHINGTNGTSTGIVPMLRVFNNTARYVDQAGLRNGSFAVYLEPWHADIEKFLQMKKNHGDEELKARDLFYALWIPDIFMRRVKDGGTWTLMCPDECRGLADVYGDEFDALYTKYEMEKKGRVTLEARALWRQILDAQMETGTPYLLYKDAANKKSNQKNLGTIKSSNLCAEIIQYSDRNESAVCNLASIALPSCIDKNEVTKEITYNFEKLHSLVRTAIYNLNQVIDVSFYPTEKTRVSNIRHRPVGLGVQGMADTFIIMGHAFCSEPARELNRHIFETMYHAALTQSCEMAKTYGAYETFVGSPASEGLLQFDLWAQARGDFTYKHSNDRYDWDALKNDVVKYGIRNSLLLAPMPTASTSQILGYNECIEPITSNIYSRRTLAGEFILTNKYLMNDLLALGLWCEKMKNRIIANNGSVQSIVEIPVELREKYKTVWEISMRGLIDMAADRGIYVCQSQSLNLWVEEPTYNTLTSMHFHGWSKGLKTGIYYLRRRAKHHAQQFTIEPEKAQIAEGATFEEDEPCEMCSA